ncbi:MAG: valine--tRNA ligase [Candidatus Aenigmatarchaeota archaeon]|nr:MAG: valine--tRNA ligase [Candidatus Aenigmarchaeota archaeon]
MEPKLNGKRWSKDFEQPIYEDWKKKGRYSFQKGSKKPVFSIDTPPPYVNTPVHIGQATTYVLMDFFARFRRMTGWNVLFPLGLDRNGLPIEMAAEKKFNVRLTDLPRDDALEKCESILQESSMASTETFLRSGISFNSWELGKGIGDIYYTDSEYYRSLTQDTFIDLWKKGLIYEDARTTNYCPGCQTTIADAEVEYTDMPTVFNDIKFKVKETGEEVIIGTTRPELVCTIGMVIFNPKDERYKHLEGKTAIAPVFDKEVPIKAHPSADMDKGTGIMMVCSFGDLADIRFFREMKLEPVIAINKDGTMNENAGPLEGLKIKEAREKMIEMLRENGQLVNQEKVMHRTPVCERSKDPIEFIAMPEFYLKQVESKPKMREFAKKINFFAPQSRQIMLDWIDSVSMDWPISRRRYYATEIPLWYCKHCGEPVIPEKGKYHRPWKDSAPVEKCPKCGKSEFRGETRVFDTWFDSSISPLYILKWSRDQQFFDKHKPCTLRPQGKEIIRTWLYYTVLKDYLLTGDCIFRDAWINYHIVDGKGKKMSKSKGNVVNPKEVLDKFGAEPFRLWAAIEGNLTKKDFRCSFDRIQGTEKTLTKLWNVARFISMFPEAEKPKKLSPLDEWVISEIDMLAGYTREQYESYDFNGPATRLKNFLWETFASHYLELVKHRAYNQEGQFSDEQQQSALYTLHYCLDTMLKLLAPVIPFITYRIYMDMRGKDIHTEEFPAKPKPDKPPFPTEELMELNSAIWKEKKDSGLSLKSEVASVTIPDKFKPIEKDLSLTHNIKKVEWGKKVSVSLGSH